MGGWIGWPEALGGSDRFAHFLDPVIARHAEAVAAVPEGTVSWNGIRADGSFGARGVGGHLGSIRALFEAPGTARAHCASLERIARLLVNKYYVDQIYDAMFVSRAKDLGLALGSFDRGIINGLGVDGAGWLTRATSAVSMWWDKWIVDGLVNLAARIVWILSYPVRMLQSGRVSNYALLIVLGVLLMLGYSLHVAGVTLHGIVAR